MLNTLIVATFRLVVTTCFSLGFLLSAGLQSRAIEKCAEYAARAINQVQMGQGCVQGPRWSPNVADHLFWCRGKTAQQMTSEDAARRSELARGCRNNTVRISVQTCDDYAWRALSQIELAHQMGNTFAACRFTGPRWDLNVNAHIGFCRTQSPGLRDTEDFERRRAVAQCATPASVPAPAPAPIPPRTSTSAPPPPHTLPPPQPLPPPQTLPPPTATQPPPVQAADQSALLNAHNSDRAKHCAPALTWSAAAAAVAQAWANQCTSNGAGGFAHDANRGGYGENLAWGTGLGAQQAVDLWYGEIKSYNFAAPIFTWNPQVGHFTQLVWRGTTQVGCAVAHCGGQNLWVCRYSPAGNMNVEARPPSFTADQARQSLMQNVSGICR